jgi:two-component system, cell cycle sensor histidine kinase and response regulator CckA
MKPEVVFGLEGAAWPSLLLNASCVVLRANTAAMDVFGEALAGEMPQLLAIWSQENGGMPEGFFARWQKSPTPTADLKFRVANGTSVKFTAAICTFTSEGHQWFVLQLLPAIGTAAALAPALVPSPAPEVPVAAAAPGEAKAALDANGMQIKQKLDCALQLARTVSLDFNNALTSILGHTSFLLDKAEAGHPWRHSLMEVEKSAQHAAEIANELTVFSRQEKEAHRAPQGNLNTMVNHCVDFFHSAHGDKIAWKIQLERELFVARFDEAKVQQALTKVLENAVEAVGTGGTGQITIQTRNMDLSEPTQDRNVRLAAGTYVCVEVADNGAGIEPEILPRIFEPFFTTKDKSHRGLGLALVYGIVTNHGGGVAISSQPGSGTSARVYLPAENQAIQEEAGPVPDEDLHGVETVMVVDDENVLLTMAETVLSEYGYCVVTANTGQKALSILSRGDVQVDLIITDLVMPTMGGRELIERVRKLAPSTRIMSTSGYVLPADKQTGTPYLQKPFTSRELLTKVKQALAATPAVD